MAEPGVKNDIDSFSGEGVRRRGPVVRALFGDIIQFIDFILVIVMSVAVAEIYHVFYLDIPIDLQNYTSAGIRFLSGTLL